MIQVYNITRMTAVIIIGQTVVNLFQKPSDKINAAVGIDIAHDAFSADNIFDAVLSNINRCVVVAGQNKPRCVTV